MKTIDFDAFRAEQNKEPIKLLIGGQVHLLPPSLPAPYALEIIRLHAAGDDVELEPEQIFEMAAKVFGGEAKLSEVLEAGQVTLAELGDLLRMVVEAYNGEDEGADPNPGAPQPEG